MRVICLVGLEGTLKCIREIRASTLPLSSLRCKNTELAATRLPANEISPRLFISGQ